MRTHARVVLVYTLLGLLLTWPMLAHLATHVPGDGIDDPSLAWNLWWVKHALVDQPQNPFAGTWQFWPIGINLAFYTLTVLNGMLSIPLQGALGLVPAYNLLLLSSFVLGGLGAYLLGLDFLGAEGRTRRGRLAAFAGGALYAFASAKLFYAALGQGNIASSQWAPFAALYMVRAARPGGRWRDAGLAALFLVLQAYAELTYASFLLIFAAVVVVWAVAANARILRLRPSGAPLRMLPQGRPPRSDISQDQTTRRLPSNGMESSGAVEEHPERSGAESKNAGAAARDPFIRGLILRFVLMAALFGLGIAPVLANMLPDMAAEGDFFTTGGGFADVFSADLVGYLVPTQLHPVLGGIVRSWSASAGFPVDKGQHVYVGYAALAIAVAGAVRGRRRALTWLWVASAGLFFLLTLGPTLRIAGADTGLPLPFRILEQLPFFKGNRYPSRYSVMLLLSLAPLAAGGVAAVAAGLRPARPAEPRRTQAAAAVTAVALTALMLFEHLSAPLPVFDLTAPPLYGRVAAEPGDFALLELPLGWRNGARVAGKQDILIMQQLWYQAAHEKRVLGGNTSRNPEYKFQYFSENPVLARLIATTNAADLPQHGALREALSEMPVTEEDRALARDWAAFTNIRYVMVHRGKLPPEAEALARDLLPLALVAEEGDLALYRVGGLPAPRRFDLNSDAGRMALGEGWSPPAGGSGRDADGELLPVYAQRPEARLLLPIGTEAATIRLELSAIEPGQEVTLVADGEALQALPLAPGPQNVEWRVPAMQGRPPLSDVRLRFRTLTPAADLAQRVNPAEPYTLLARSAGQETGDYAHVFVNGIDVSPNRRGYNLVALAPGSGEVLSSAAFDTHADAAAGSLLAEWLAGLPDGTIVAGAVRDEASQSLGEEAVAALRALGVQADLRGLFRWGHAFIATKGDPASAQEELDSLRPVQLSRGAPLSEPGASAEVYAVEVVAD